MDLPEDGDPLGPPAAVNPALWVENDMALTTPQGRVEPVMHAIQEGANAGVSVAGWIEAAPRTLASLLKDGHFEYGRVVNYLYSVTARTSDGTGSGWAAWVGEDWSKADPNALVARAIDLAQRSRNPVAVEPGHWTVIMAPEAWGALARFIGATSVGTLVGELADAGGMPFSKPGGGNKLGLKVFDERVTLSADPMDPEAPFLAFDLGNWFRPYHYEPVTWVDHGVLKMLSYSARAGAAAHGIGSVINSGALRMSGGPTSIEEMIATTPRGIYVTRFANIGLFSSETLFMSGVTRDGTFLIENGKITKPIKNMRFEDSPMFCLNNLEAIGPAKRVAIGGLHTPYFMPAIKVRDFAFTSLTDAV
jgi:predicted Zn-dependent protease